ncbi:MAG: DUF1109 domain-containing protein [Burkholderiales bacterium]|nr:MAG: DUF1109 domain-containing protein [Burkholderiales bacterium]
MATDALIARLAQDAAPVRPAAIGARFALALVLALPLTTILMAAVPGFGLRPDLSAVLSGSPDLPKHLFTLAMLAAAWFACTRLARPGASLRGVSGAVGLPVAAMLALAVAALVTAAPQARAALLLGETWTSCAASIALLSLPAFAGAIVAMRGLAPTRLGLAGAAAGLFAGAAGAAVFALHCTEAAAPFVAVWYLLGMAVPTAAGALAGPRLLRW